ncbi:hypothetical protein TNCV_526191 [Trichonephila clavipes]|nr:hypothetical protein TNCV_526191 [Trichonephila clavipes]
MVGTHGQRVMSSNPTPLKTRRVEELLHVESAKTQNLPVRMPSGYGHELGAGVSWFPVLVRLKTHHVEGADVVKSIKAQIFFLWCGSLERGLPAQVPSSSIDRCPSPKALVLLLCDG